MGSFAGKSACVTGLGGRVSTREVLCVSPTCNDLHPLEREESTGSKVGLGYGELRGEIGAGVGEWEAVPAKPCHPCVA